MPPAVRNSQEQWAPPSRREGSLPNPAELPRVAGDAAAAQAAPERPDAAALGFRSAALTVWTGDFNYRIDMTRCAGTPWFHTIGGKPTRALANAWPSTKAYGAQAVCRCGMWSRSLTVSMSPSRYG